MTALQHVVERARVAVLARAGHTLYPDRVKGIVQQQVPQSDTYSNYNGLPGVVHPVRPLVDLLRTSDKLPPDVYSEGSHASTVRPCVVTVRPSELPLPKMLPTFPSADAVRGEMRLSRGAVRLWALLHRLGCDVARQREYVAVTDQVVFHLPAVTVAGVLGYTDRHIRGLSRELEQLGLLDCGGHAQTVMGRNLYDGTVWAVKTKPSAEPPRVRADEWKHNWRPGFAADVEGRTGAAAHISELHAAKAEPEELYRAAKHWAAVPVGILPPAIPSSENADPAGLRGVVEMLTGLWQTHAAKRAREVGRLANALCAALSEPERRRYWCRVLWEALRSENEGRNGLQVLAAQVARLAADLLESAPWRNPGAVLAGRLRATI